MIKHHGGKMIYKILYTIKRSILLIMLLFFVLQFSNMNGQTSLHEDLPSGISQSPYYNSHDSLSNITASSKNYWLPATEIVSLNIIVWSYSKFLTKRSFADISWETVKNNFSTGFVWDNDRYITNQFMHPFHGSNYFNASRANGLNFWESSAYTFGGSLMWEMFMEKEAPSFNDLVNTTVSGITLGEISNRVSNLIIDESSVGLERVIRELSSTLINPMQGFNRLIKGEMWSRGLSNELPEFHFTFSTGIHNVFFNNRINNNKSYLTLRANLDYGNQFNVSEHEKPFDYFTLHVEANIGKGNDIFGIIASGVVWDRNVKLFNSSRNIVGIYKEIDILTNDIYKFSATSLTGQLINTVRISSVIRMKNYLGLSAILMGATNSKYAVEADRDYNIGPGVSGKVGIVLELKNYGELNANYKRYWIHTLSGAESEEFVGLLNVGVNYQIREKCFLGLDYLLYERYGDYKYYPNTQDSNSAIRLYIKQII